jgi:hypothetical protein
VDVTTLFQLRSLINDEVRNANDKMKAFYNAMERHDFRTFQRKEDEFPIIIGGRQLHEYLKVLRKIKSLGGTEFDEYWSEDRA